MIRSDRAPLARAPLDPAPLDRRPRATVAWLARAGLAVTLFVAPPARADEHPTLPVDAAKDGLVAGASTVFWITTESLRPVLGPTLCRWCELPNGTEGGVNDFDTGVRRAFRWGDPKAASVTSDVAAFVLTPATTLGVLAWAEGKEESFTHAAEDALVITEAVSVAMVVNQITKFTVARTRPYAQTWDASEPQPKPPETPTSDDHLSFFSGHATFTFALVTATGTVASLRKFRSAPWIWAGGLTAATLTGYLRIAADKHYATDVLTGAALGAAFGAALPLVFHRPIAPLGGATVLVVPDVGGARLTVSGLF